MARRALRSLRNVDYHDRELLYILDDNGDNEGWVATSDLETLIRINHPEGETATDKEKQRYARQCIATRFSWMVRYKWVERDEKRTMWRLTDLGRDLMTGNLTKGIQKSLDKASKGDRILIMRALTGDYRAQDPSSIMLRREWQAGSQNGRSRR